MKKVAFKTLGCRLNQLETDAIVTDFTKAGYEIVPFYSSADVYVINTCTVTNQSDQKSKNTINQAIRHVDTKGAVVVTGCMVTSQKEYLQQRDEITFVVENGKKHAVLPLVDSYLKGTHLNVEDYKPDIFKFPVVEKGFHTRSAIKIHDGCNNHCTFCIVPKVRGRAKSRSWDDIKENIEKVLELGYKEIVLTGVNISRYHHDNIRFEDLVEKILSIEGDFRVRISSMEPEGFTDKFIDLFENPKLCQHLHLCLQSGSDTVLKRMRRFYTVGDYTMLINTFRRKYPYFNFTTDVIVGFPGETEKEFQETVNLARELQFSHIHTFKYSLRKGTIAETLPNHLEDNIKNDRSEIIRELAEENKLKFYSRFIGKTQKVLLEQHKKDPIQYHGYGEHYLPVFINSDNLETNQFTNVKISGIDFTEKQSLIGEIISDF